MSRVFNAKKENFKTIESIGERRNGAEYLEGIAEIRRSI